MLSQSLVTDVGELVYSKERLSGKPWKIQLTCDQIWVLTEKRVSASPWPDRMQAAYPLLRAPSLNWNYFPSLKEVLNAHGVNALEMYLLSSFTSTARYAQAVVAGIMEMLSSQRHFVSNNIFILHPSLAGGEFFCLLKSHSSFGTKCSPVSRARRWFYWRTVLQTKTMLYFTTPFELLLCHFPEEHDRPTTKLCFKILCPI